MPTPEEKRTIERAELQEQQRQERQALHEQQNAEIAERERNEKFQKAALKEKLEAQHLEQIKEQKQQQANLQEKINNARGFGKLARGLSGAEQRDKQTLETLQTAIKQRENVQQTARQNLALEQGKAQAAEQARHQQQDNKLGQAHRVQMEVLKREHNQQRDGITQAKKTPKRHEPHHQPRPPAGMVRTQPTEQNNEPPRSVPQSPPEKPRPPSLKREWKAQQERDSSR